MADKWETVELERLVEPGRSISYGIVQPGAPIADGIPIVRVSDVRNGMISTAAPLRVSPNIEADYVRTRLKGGELLLTLVGTVGEAAVVPASLAGWNTARAVGVIPVRSDIGAHWVKLALKSPVARQIISSRLNTTVQATLNLRDVAQLPIILPPKNDRESIIHILSTLDNKIELNQRMNDTLETSSRAIFQSWFVDFDPVRAKAEGRCPGLPKPLFALFPDSFEDSLLGEVPSGWKVRSFVETVEIIGGGTPNTSLVKYWDGDIPWFSIADAQDSSTVWVIDTEKKITQDGLANSSARILPEGTTIITARGTVGKIALVGAPMAMNQSCYGLRGKVGGQGLFNYFMTRELVSTLRQHSHGSVFDTITRDTLASVSVVVPPAEIINGFEASIHAALQRIRESLVENRTLAALRDALLPRLISGEIGAPSK